MSFRCRHGIGGERFCDAEMKDRDTDSPTYNSSGEASEIQNIETDNVNGIIQTTGQTLNYTPDTDNSASTPGIRRTLSGFGSKLQMGLRRRETVSGFKSRRWSFSSRRPTSQSSSFKEKQLLQRRNSIESKARHVEEQPIPKPFDCKRFHIRRGALSNPELMAMPQNVREKIQKDVEVRQKSLKRKISNFLAVRLDLDKEIDLF